MKDTSRRNFMRRAVGAEATKISSVLVQLRPELYESAAADIAALSGVEIFQPQEVGNNKLVLIIETDSDNATLQRIQQITATAGVITADLTYSYSDHDDE